MTYYKVATTSAPLLEITSELWGSLITHLRIQGNGKQESGAFLLGHTLDGLRVVLQFIPYEQLQADALHDDFVALSAPSFARLWEFCRKNGLSVVADVHTHRFGSYQSFSDRENPMLAIPGHIAFIMPQFAQHIRKFEGIGMYVYQGSHQWLTCTNDDIEILVTITGSKK